MSTPNQQQDAAHENVPAWRKLFKTKSEMDSSPMKFLISGILPEGITFIGALPGSGKTWFCLSLAKALCTGEKLLGQFSVTEQSNVLYLIPESGERSFRHRMETMGIPDDDRFLCRTMMNDPISLDNSQLLAAVRELKPVIFLDTLVRFYKGSDESDASQAAHIAEMIQTLYREGAKAVVCVHHSLKSSAKQDASLENSLRGSGDWGAVPDAVYSLKVEDADSLRIRVQNLKARDFEPVSPFVIEGRPYIDDQGDFELISKVEESKNCKQKKGKEIQFESAVAANPRATYNDLAKQLDMTRSGIQHLARRLGWTKGGEEIWVKGPAPSPLRVAA